MLAILVTGSLASAFGAVSYVNLRYDESICVFPIFMTIGFIVAFVGAI